MEKIPLYKKSFDKIRNIFFPFYRSKEIKNLFYLLSRGESKNMCVAMFVGGCVRKFLSNQKIDDIDIACIFSPDQIKEKLKNTNIKIIDTGVEHGSLTVISNKKKFEVTTLRKDEKTDGRYAEISFTDDWYQDSKRRDFTINAIYMDHKGKIYDPQSGLHDLKKKKVKFIGDPIERITEDYLRIIRFIRFSLQYQCEESDKGIITAIKLNLNGIKNLSKERILSEITKIFNLKNINILLINEEIKKIFSIVFPEFKYLERIKKINNLTKFKKINLNPEIIFSILLIDDTSNHEYFFHKYRTSNQFMKNLNLIANNYEIFKKNKNFFKSDFKKNIYLLGKNNIKKLLTFIYCAEPKFSKDLLDSLILEIENFKIPKLPIDGDFLINRGIIDGKTIGLLLKKLETEWINDNFVLDENKISLFIKKFKD